MAKTRERDLLGKAFKSNIVSIEVGEKGVVGVRGVEFHTARTRFAHDESEKVQYCYRHVWKNNC
jgi:hypothetical protein